MDRREQTSRVAALIVLGVALIAGTAWYVQGQRNLAKAAIANSKEQRAARL
jgi:hypothetical protein